MIPQLVVAVWLTLTFIALGMFLYEFSNGNDGQVPPCIILSIIYTVIPIIALLEAGFWTIK